MAQNSANISQNETLAYVIAVSSVLVIVGLYHSLRYLYRRWIQPKILLYFAYIQHNFVFGNHPSFRLTYLQIIILSIYLSANGVAIGLRVDNATELATRSAVVALLNLVLVSGAGHIHWVAEAAGLTLSTYRFLHYWIGRVTIIEALLHAILIIPQHHTVDNVFISGCITLGSLSAILLSSLWFPRRLRSLFDKTHYLLYISVMIGLFWHVQFPKASIPSIAVSISGGIWLITQLFLLIPLAVRHYSGGLAKTVDTVWMDEDITKIQLTGQATRVFPGCYFYAYFPGPMPFRNFIQGYRMMPIPDISESVSGEASTMDLVISHKGQHSQAVLSIRKGQDLLLVGPYGKDLQLHRFETVILAARGLGILGVLPFALHLAGRKQQDSMVRDQASRLRDSEEAVFRDVTRKVDLVWWLDNNDEEKWAFDQFQSLQSLDPDNKLLVVWCVYPAPRTGLEPFSPNEHWQMLYKFDSASLSREIRQEARYPGKMVVLACGDREFVDGVRGATLENISSSRIIDFAQVDFCPKRNFTRTNATLRRKKNSV